MKKEKKLVKSQRGSYGGYVLEKPASEISLSNLLVSIPKILKYVNETKKIKINDTKNIFNIFIILTK